MTKKRSAHHHAHPPKNNVEVSQPELTPSKPGFSTEEAIELLGMCTAANYLGPVAFSPFPVGLIATDDPKNPLPNDDGKTYPYPRTSIWPEGWTPGVASEDPEKPWQNSILTSKLSNGIGVNSAIITYNAERNAYAIAFAGTLNQGAAMEDLAGLLIPAGPVNLDFFKSTETYAHIAPETPIEAVGGLASNPVPEPPPQIPLVHLGYREAVESLTIGSVEPSNLSTILNTLADEEINLYVTGHSLGASVAQLFSAWVKAGGVPAKKIHIKCYSFATPKSCNATMASNYDLALSNDGFSYCVSNSLDTAPQLPPTREVASDLINPAISSDVVSKADPTGLYAASPLAPIVKMILHSAALTNAAQQHEPNQSSEPIPFPLSLIPFPFSIPINFFNTMSKAASKPSPAQPSMAFVGMGAPYVLSAQPPVVYNGRCYPLEFFPGREPDDFVDIPDMTTREWWQHWPFNYAKYLAELAE